MSARMLYEPNPVRRRRPPSRTEWTFPEYACRVPRLVGQVGHPCDTAASPYLRFSPADFCYPFDLQGHFAAFRIRAQLGSGDETPVHRQRWRGQTKHRRMAYALDS